mgnify:CR=1 FL=1
MLTVLLVVQSIVAVAMVGIILLQHTSADGLSGLSGGGGGNSLISSRASANILTRTTAILAFIFMANCLAMATIAARQANITDKFLKDTTDISAPQDDTIPESQEAPQAPLVE